MFLKKGVISVRNIVQIFLIYLMIIMHGAVIWSAIIGDGYVPLMFVAITVLLVIARFHLPFRKTYLLYCAATAACYFLSAFLNGIGLSAGLNIKTAIIIDINILIASTIFYLGKERAVTLYVKMVVFFAFISVICFACQQIIGTAAFPSSLFPYLRWGRGHWGYLFYSYTRDPRNYGIFYEPGVYQVLLNTVLYILLFWNEFLCVSSKAKQRYIIIILIAIATAASTTGYISALIILAAFLIKKHGVNPYTKKLERQIILIAVVVVVVFAFDYLRNGSESYFKMYVLDKINETNITTGEFNYNSSGGARLFIFNQALEALKTNPFFGVGSVSLSNSIASEFWSGFGTGNVLFSTIATKGLVTTFLTITPIIVIAYRNRKNNLSFIVYLLIYINTIVAQSQLLYSSFVLLALIGNLKTEDVNKLEAENE